MKTFSLSHLSDQTLLTNLSTLVSRDRAITAELLAHIAEVDARKLYLPAACPSMIVYCERVLGLTTQAAYKRIRVARAAREFPAIFPALAEGRLHLSTVMKLAPHLTAGTAADLLAAAANKSDPEVDHLLALRFPQPDVATRLQPVVIITDQLSARIVDPVTAGRVEAPTTPPRLAPLSPGKYALQLTMKQSTHDKLRHAQELLSHTVRFGDVAEVLDRALDALIGQLERRKFAATSKPRRCQQHSPAQGHRIPAEVRRAVTARDGGQCTFVSETGQRCTSRTLIEFDHIVPVARGGQATIGNTRLTCRAHNQYEAERAFGAEFMRRKRQEARQARPAAQEQEAARLAAQEQAVAQEQSAAQQAAAERAKELDVVPWLRALGFRLEQARHAAAQIHLAPDASLEQRVRAALALLAPPHRKSGSVSATPCTSMSHQGSAA